MYQKVKFYDNAGFGNVFECQFMSKRAFDSFVSNYQYAGGCLNFNYDIFEESREKYDLPVIKNSGESFVDIMNFLYDGKILFYVSGISNKPEYEAYYQYRRNFHTS